MSEENKLTTEIEILAETIETRTNEFNSAFEKIKKELEAELDHLKKYNVMLQSVPTKIAKQIEETIPKIALELDTINNKKINELKRKFALILVKIFAVSHISQWIERFCKY
jgi:tRNA G18 (ribose-2'-O)-methylase SpoU